MIKSKFHLEITGLDMQTYCPAWIKSVIEDWVRDSGVKRSMGGVIFADADPVNDKITYHAQYDSYWWTGVGEPVVKDPKIIP